jgi:hypothetical protein
VFEPHGRFPATCRYRVYTRAALPRIPRTPPAQKQRVKRFPKTIFGVSITFYRRASEKAPR